MKKIWSIAVLGIIALTSCESKIDLLGDIDAKPDASATVFTATTESAVTKTALDDNYNVLWQNGDMITIVDGNGHVGAYSTTSTTTQGEFTHSSGDEAGTSPYTAYYPSTIYNGGTLTLPAEQTYVTENISGAPMMAVSSTTSLGFKNLEGIIKLSLTTNQSGQKVRSIALSANEGMSGPFTVTNDAAVVSGTAGVTLNCGTEGVAIGSKAIPFYIAVPAKTYTGLSITVTTTAGTSQTFTLKAGKTVVVARSEITSINLSANNIHSAYDLAAGDVTVQAGEVATVTGSNKNSVLTIGAGATVTLQNATLMQIVTQGDATLILSGTNTQTTVFSDAAIKIADNATLTIDGTGSLNVDRGWSQNYGCIYGPNANLIVNGGTMVLHSNKGAGSSNTWVAINLNNYTQNGGNVEAYGKFTNDVGNSYANGMQISNDVLITGGTLRTEGATALWVGNNISISGGTVTAIGTYAQDSGSTGIVPGGNKTGGKLTISGGTVRAEGNGGGDGQGPGIGRRTDACGDIIISGGDVTVSSTARSGFAGGAAAIGTGSDAVAVGCNITITSGITRLVVTKGVNAQAPIGKGNANSSVGTISIDGVVNPTAKSFFEHLNLEVSNSGNTWTLTPATNTPPTSLANLKDMVNAGWNLNGYLGRYVYADGSIGTVATGAVGIIAHFSPNATTNASSKVDGSRVMVLALNDLVANVEYGNIAIPSEPAITGASQTTWMVPTYWEWIDMSKSLGKGSFQTLIGAVGMSEDIKYWTSSTSSGGYGHYYVYYYVDGYADGVYKIFTDFATRNPHPTARACFAY